VNAKLESEKLSLPPKTTLPFNVTIHLKSQPQEPFQKGKILMETDHPREKEIDVRFLIQFPSLEKKK
jgi:hypothetical protein